MYRLASTLLVGLLSAAAPVAAAPPAERDIGVSAIVVNKVQAARADHDRQLRVGDRVFQNERIDTGPDGRAQIIFLDETTITVGPSSSVVLDTFVYDPDKDQHSVVIQATHGVLRFVSGSGNSRAFQIRTPVATVGVRGTILDILVGPEGATTVLVVEGAADLRSLGSGRLEALNRVGLASTVANSQAVPTPPAPPSEAVRNRLRVLSPAGGRQFANAGDVPLPSSVDTKTGIVIDGTLPAEVLRDRLRPPTDSVGTGGAIGKPSDGKLEIPCGPGCKPADTTATVVKNPPAINVKTR